MAYKPVLPNKCAAALVVPRVLVTQTSKEGNFASIRRFNSRAEKNVHTASVRAVLVHGC